MEYIGAAFFGLLFLVLGFRAFADPFWGLVGLLIASIATPGEVYPLLGILHLEKLFTLIVFVTWFMKGKIEVPPISKRVLMFWGTMFLSIPFALYWTGALNGFINFFTTVLYHLMIVNLVDSRDKFKKILMVYILLLGWVGGGSLWGYMHGQTFKGSEIHGVTRAAGIISSVDDPNSLGVFLVSGLPLAALLMTDAKGVQRLVAGTVLLMSIVVVTLTGSRGSFASLLILLVVAVVTSKKGVFLIPVIAVAMAAGWQMLPQPVKDRYYAMTGIVSGTQEADESYQARVNCRIAGWHMFLDRPVTGVGAGVFKFANGMRYWPGEGRRRWLQAHNLYVQLLAELGIVGVIIWLRFFSGLVGTTMKLRRFFKGRMDIEPIFRGYPRACFLTVFVLLVNGWSTHSLYFTAWYFLAALTGVLWKMYLQEAKPVRAKFAWAGPESLEATP